MPINVAEAEGLSPNLKLEALEVGYGRKSILLADSEFVSGIHYVVGSNGAGKSSLLRTIAGSLRPRAGGVATYPESSIVGYMPQRITPIPGMRCRSFVHYVSWLNGMRHRDLHSRVDECLELVLFDVDPEQLMSKVSEGYLRRLALAASLIRKPSIILLDEPTSGLDAAAAQQFRKSLHSLSAGAIRVIVIATHLVDDMRANPGEVHAISGGRLTRVMSRVALENAIAKDGTFSLSEFY